MIRFAVALLALSLLAGCGIKSGLDRPDPLWGEDRARAADTVRQREEQAEEQRRNQTQTPPTPQVQAPPAEPLPSTQQ